MADLEELVFKVGVDVNANDLKKLRDEINKLKEDLKNNALKLGVNIPLNSAASTNMGAATAANEDIASSLQSSEKHLLEIVNILKSDHEKKIRKGDSEESSNAKGPIPFVNDVMNSNAGSLAGGAVGGTLGAIFGGPVGMVGGAQLGAAIGGIVQKMAEVAKEKIETVAKMFDSRLSEDIHFRQLSQQTGMTVDQIYKLGIQAKLAGTSLEEVVDSNQQLANELIGGLDEKKAQLLMALNINPREALLQSGGDIGKLNQMIFERAFKATGNLPAPFRSAELGILGYSPEGQNARRYLYRGDVQARADQTLNVATANGKTPFETGEKLQQTILSFIGATEDFKASIRSALTTGNIAQNLSTGLMRVKADVVQLIVGAVSDIEGLGNHETKSTLQQKTSVINDTVDWNVKQRQMIEQQLHRAPASSSGAIKSAAAR